MGDERSVCKLAFCYLRGWVVRESTLVGIRAIIPDWGYLRPHPTVPLLLSDVRCLMGATMPSQVHHAS